MEMADSSDTLLSSTLTNCSGSNLNGPRFELCDTHNSQPQDIFKDTCLITEVSKGSPDELMRLDVGGSLFVTSRATLERVPNTRLSDLSELDTNYNKDTRSWWFDRNPELFNCILDFFRCEELHFPHNFCGPAIKKELLYWRIHECDIAPCCWNR